jgi:thiol-disulfide isomerase/thioredoxin
VSLFAKLHSEMHLPGFDGATGWLNSEPLTPEGLRGKVVLVDFWTYTCINWLRTLGYVRAWHERYVGEGLVVVGVPTPEFPVESEMALKMLLRESGVERVPDDLVSVADEGFEAQADWQTLGSPESYLGYEQGQNFVSANTAEFDEPQDFGVPERLELNQWALSGNWTLGPGKSVLNEEGGSLVFRFHARDVNLVMGPPGAGPVPFRVRVDGEPPGDAHGLDVDEAGNGTLDRPPRLHQLIRERGSIADRTFEIAFLAPGAEAYCFTFG